MGGQTQVLEKLVEKRIPTNDFNKPDKIKIFFLPNTFKTLYSVEQTCL